jgi:hypothetical protein
MKRPALFDKIMIEGDESTVAAVALFQMEAPRFWTVTNSAGVELRIEWRTRVWGVEGKGTYAPKEKPRSAPREVNPMFQPARPIGVAAVEAIKLSAEVMALHERLDRARDRHNQADPTAPTWAEYEKCILGVDLADPGFYRGRVRPIEPRPRYVLPAIDYAGISSRMTFRESPEIEEENTDEMEPILATEGTCRVCGCTDYDCTQCIKKTGAACYWVEPDLCSACAADAKMQK